MSFKSNELKPIPPAPFTSPQVPEFTEEDYLLYLEHPLWTKDDTMSLLDAVRIFDHDWNLVASTFHGDPTKTALVCLLPTFIIIIIIYLPSSHLLLSSSSTFLF